VSSDYREMLDFHGDKIKNYRFEQDMYLTNRIRRLEVALESVLRTDITVAGLMENQRMAREVLKDKERNLDRS
jgi:hypothetical protein